MTTLVIAAHEAQQLDADTARLVAAARRLEEPVHVLVIGHEGADEAARQAAAIDGVACVLLAAAPQLAQPSAETLARQIDALAGDHRRILAAHTLAARAALPRVAARRGAAWLSDVVAIESPQVLVRPMYAGSVLARVAPQAAQLLMTLRASAFAPAGPAATPCAVVPVPAVEADARTRLLGRETLDDSRPDLGRARIVVAGGRGLGAAEHMALVEALADRLGGAVGASRAAVDAGFAPNSAQIGQTGRTVAPELYLGAGISGAIQHLAGIKDARVIVAVNKDADAPIFSVADIGLVGDLFEVLPALTAALPDLRDAA